MSALLRHFLQSAGVKSRAKPSSAMATYRKNTWAMAKKDRNRSSSAASIWLTSIRRSCSDVILNSSRSKSPAMGRSSAADSCSMLVSDGFLLPRSISPMYWSESPASSARRSCVISRLRRISLIFLPKSF